MEYDFKNNATFGSDGGDIEFNNHKHNEVGYSDGFRPWVPFPTAPSVVPPAYDGEKMLGMSYGYFANRGEISSMEGMRSQSRMYELNNNWVCLTIVNYQDTYHSTRIYADHLATPTEGDIRTFVAAAHQRGVKVCLKPMVHSRDNVWRAHIGFPDLNMDDLNAYWEPWFESYKNFILTYAELAQSCGAEMLCIGCEMLGTEHRHYDWEYIIKEVRRVYNGKIVYNTNHDHEDDQEWFGLCDYLGTSAYYPVGENGVTYEGMVRGWEKVRNRLNSIAEKYGKQYLFMEIGCRSVDFASQHPWDFTEDLPVNEGEQYFFYKSCMDTFLNDPHFAGVFWWDWSTFLKEDDATGFSIYKKRTETYLKELYGGLTNGQE